MGLAHTVFVFLLPTAATFYLQVSLIQDLSSRALPRLLVAAGGAGLVPAAPPEHCIDQAVMAAAVNGTIEPWGTH